MTLKPQKPLPQQQAQVDLSEAETMKCDECGNYTFIQSFFLKRLSPIVSPTGKEAIIPIQAFACGNCGKVPDKMKSEIDG
tara:strand:- start:411 stop:650 length:240 start_codon:yes stop_codon:yes gene_type:complete